MKETPNQGYKITLSWGHMGDLLLEGFTGSRQERCSVKNLLQIDVPFNYFDSTKERKEKVDGVHAEKIKTPLVIHLLVHKDLLAAIGTTGHPSLLSSPL